MNTQKLDDNKLNSKSMGSKHNFSIINERYYCKKSVWNIYKDITKYSGNITVYLQKEVVLNYIHIESSV